MKPSCFLKALQAFECLCFCHQLTVRCVRTKFDNILSGVASGVYLLSPISYLASSDINAVRSIFIFLSLPYNISHNIDSHFHDGCDSFDQKFDADLSITLP